MGDVGRRKDDFTVRWYVNHYSFVRCSGLEYFSLGPDANEPITSLAMEGKAVWAASGTNAIKYLRGKVVRTVMLQ